MNVQSGPLLLLLLRDRLGLMKLTCKLFVDALAEGLFDKFARIAARLSSKTFGRDNGVTIGADDDFDTGHTAPPCTLIVSLIDPSAKVCSVTLWPQRLASRVARQTAYICKNFAKFCSLPHRP